MPSMGPLNYLSSAWSGVWASASLDRAISAEAAILQKHVRSPFHHGRVSVDLPSLGLGEQFINTLDVNPDVDSKERLPMVLTHGAGSGMGFFFKNIEPLATLGGVRRRLLVFDWLGQAGSSRPSYPYGGLHAPSFVLSEDQKIDAAIKFAVDSMEAWRAAMHLERFDLLAHSMGGYLATQYAMTYPERVRRLVLISPVGWAATPTGKLASGKAGGFFGALWGSGLGNFGFARTVGRMAKGTLQNIMIGRLNIRDEKDATLLAEYFWNTLCSQPISGEKNVNWLLDPYFSPAPFGFYAKRPVSSEPAERLAKLPPTTLLYGSHDLHYIPTMPEAVATVQAASHQPVRMHHVPNADHHLYCDNPAVFHRHCEKALA